MKPASLNKLCELGDFADPEIRGLIREAFPSVVARHPDLPAGRERRGYWEVAMALLALERGGALRQGAEILGLGTGQDPTPFWLTNHVRRVVAADRYLAPHEALGARSPSPLMLSEPAALWAAPWRPGRLVVQHMDPRALAYEDLSFDAVFCTGSLRTLGGAAQIARVMDEACRVVRPGGVVSVCADFRLAGPAPGARDAPLVDAEMLDELVVGDRPWEPVAPLDLSIGPETASTEVDFTSALSDRLRDRVVRERDPLWYERDPRDHPELVIRHGEHVYTSVHVALRRQAGRAAISVTGDVRAARPVTASALSGLARHLPEPLVVLDAGSGSSLDERCAALGDHVTLLRMPADADRIPPAEALALPEPELPAGAEDVLGAVRAVEVGLRFGLGEAPLARAESLLAAHDLLPWALRDPGPASTTAQFVRRDAADPPPNAPWGRLLADACLFDCLGLRALAATLLRRLLEGEAPAEVAEEARAWLDSADR